MYEKNNQFSIKGKCGKKDKLIFNVIYAIAWGFSLNNIKQIGGIEIKVWG